MRDDRVVEALERGMRRPLALALAAFLISMGAFLVGVMLIVDSTTKVSFPKAVAVTTPAPSPSAAPVSFSTSMVGTTTHASLSRGGQASVPSRSTRPTSIG
jgi:hypothetical protein